MKAIKRFDASSDKNKNTMIGIKIILSKVRVFGKLKFIQCASVCK